MIHQSCSQSQREKGMLEKKGLHRNNNRHLLSANWQWKAMKSSFLVPMRKVENRYKVKLARQVNGVKWGMYKVEYVWWDRALLRPRSKEHKGNHQIVGTIMG